MGVCTSCVGPGAFQRRPAALFGCGHCISDGRGMRATTGRPPLAALRRPARPATLLVCLLVAHERGLWVGLAQCLIRALAIGTYVVSRSIPRKRAPSITAAAPVLPLPANGSSTIAPASQGGGVS